MIQAQPAVATTPTADRPSKPVRRTRRPAAWGQLADAERNGVTVEVHERIGGRPTWRLSVRLPDAWFSFDLNSTAALQVAADLLAGKSESGGDEVSLGQWDRSEVVLTRDREFADRAFVRIGPPAGPVVRFTFAGRTFDGLAAALREVLGRVHSRG